MNTIKQKIKIFLTVSILTISFTTPTYGTNYCVTDRCKKASADAINSENASNLANKKANDLKSTISALESRITSLSSAINASEIKAHDLKNQIKLTKAKLDNQQQTLAKLLVDLHFTEKDDTLSLLASSDSISDFTEKQSRVDSAKDNVIKATQKVKSEKLNLEAQKREIDRTLADQQNLRRAVDQNKAETQRLKTTYEHNAANFAKDAEKARKIKAEEIAKEIARLNSVGAVGQGINSYPYRNACPDANLTWADHWGYVCQCVHYTGYKVKERWGINVRYWGNAYSWDDSARASGYRVDTKPAVHTVAVNNSGAWGHVMWVESVNPNGTINVSEYNNSYSSKSHREGDYGFRTIYPHGLYFIHFN